MALIKIELESLKNSLSEKNKRFDRIEQSQEEITEKIVCKHIDELKQMLLPLGESKTKIDYLKLVMKQNDSSK